MLLPSVLTGSALTSTKMHLPFLMLLLLLLRPHPEAPGVLWTIVHILRWPAVSLRRCSQEEANPYSPQGCLFHMPLPTPQSPCPQEKTKADFEGTPAPADGAEPAAETAQADGEAGGDVEGEAIDSAADEVDKRSVYVGNVDYEVTPEELQEHFKASCGSVDGISLQMQLMSWGWHYICASLGVLGSAAWEELCRGRQGEHAIFGVSLDIAQV